MPKLKKALFRWWDEDEAINKAKRTDAIVREGELVATEAHQCVASYRLARLGMRLSPR